MKRRNVEGGGGTGKLRRAAKRSKLNDGCSPLSVFVSFKFLLVWMIVIILDFIAEFRFELLYPFWVFLCNISETFRYKGISYLFSYVFITLTIDMFCYYIIPIHWLFLASSTYVWIQFTCTERGFTLFTILVWIALLCVETLVRLREFKQLPLQFEICRPFAAHGVGYPIVSFGIGCKSYVHYRLRLHKKRVVAKENEFYYSLLQKAVYPSAAVVENGDLLVANASNNGDADLIPRLEYQQKSVSPRITFPTHHQNGVDPNCSSASSSSSSSPLRVAMMNHNSSISFAQSNGTNINNNKPPNAFFQKNGRRNSLNNSSNISKLNVDVRILFERIKNYTKSLTPSSSSPSSSSKLSLTAQLANQVAKLFRNFVEFFSFLTPKVLFSYYASKPSDSNRRSASNNLTTATTMTTNTDDNEPECQPNDKQQLEPPSPAESCLNLKCLQDAELKLAAAASFCHEEDETFFNGDSAFSVNDGDGGGVDQNGSTTNQTPTDQNANNSSNSQSGGGGHKSGSSKEVKNNAKKSGGAGGNSNGSGSNSKNHRNSNQNPEDLLEAVKCKDNQIWKLELENQRLKSDLQTIRQCESDLRKQLTTHKNEEKTFKASICNYQNDIEHLQKKLQNYLSIKQQDRQTIQKLEKQLEDERKKAKLSVELQAASEKKARLAEENAARVSAAVATRTVCSESCRNRQREWEHEMNQLKKELIAKDDQLRLKELLLTEYKEIKTKGNMLMQTLAILHDKNTQLEESLKLEKVLKVELFNALESAQRQINKQMRSCLDYEKEIRELKTKVSFMNASSKLTSLMSSPTSNGFSTSSSAVVGNTVTSDIELVNRCFSSCSPGVVGAGASPPSSFSSSTPPLEVPRSLNMSPGPGSVNGTATNFMLSSSMQDAFSSNVLDTVQTGWNTLRNHHHAMLGSSGRSTPKPPSSSPSAVSTTSSASPPQNQQSNCSAGGNDSSPLLSPKATTGIGNDSTGAAECNGTNPLSFDRF